MLLTSPAPGIVTQPVIIVTPESAWHVTTLTWHMTHASSNTRHNSHPDQPWMSMLKWLPSSLSPESIDECQEIVKVSATVPCSWVITFQTRCSQRLIWHHYHSWPCREHNYTSHSRPERDISAINRSSELWNLADITHHTTAVWVSPATTTAPKCLTANNNTVILSQADMTVTTRDRIIGTREWAGRLRFIRSTNHWWRREGGRQEPIWVFALLIVQWN